MVAFRNVKAGLSLSNPNSAAQLTELFGGSPSDSGERIGASAVLGLPSFFNGVRLIANGVARTDRYVYKLNDKGKEPDEQHDAHWLLNWKANDWQHSFSWLHTLVSNALIFGNSYSWIDRANGLAAYNLDSRNTYPIAEYQEGRLTALYYGSQVGGYEVVFPADDVVHIRNLSLGCGHEGLSVFDNLRNALGKALAIQRFSTIYFKNGSHIQKVLKIPGWLNAQQQEELRNSMASLHGGLSHAHRLAVLMGGAELESLPISAEDSQLVESAELTLTDVANILGIPQTKLGARGAISYGSLEQDNLMFLSDCLDGWFSQIENELTVKLLKPRQQGSTHAIEFDRASLMASDPSYTSTPLERFKAKLIDQNEARAELGYPPAPEPEPVPPLVPAQQPPETAPQTAQDAITEPPAAPADKSYGLALKLSQAALGRIKTRITKAVNAGKLRLQDRYDAIEETLPGLNTTTVFSQLDNLQTELNEVLPEQRAGVIDQWNTNDLALTLLKDQSA